MLENIFDSNDGNDDSEHGDQYQWWSVRRLWSQMEYIGDMFEDYEGKRDEFDSEDNDLEFFEDESQVLSGKDNPDNNPKRKNTEISPNFLVWKFCWKAQFLHRPKIKRKNCQISRNIHSKKLGKISLFYTVKAYFILP